MKTLEHPLSVAQPWSDRFRTPTADDLLDALPRSLRPATDAARARLVAGGSLEEHLRWLGIWRWSFTYEAACGAAPEAYVIPDPRTPRICVPLDAAAVVRLFTKPCASFVRDSVERCAAVAGVRWATWDIESKGMVESLFDILRPGP